MVEEDEVYSMNMMKRSLIAIGCLLIAGPALAQFGRRKDWR